MFKQALLAGVVALWCGCGAGVEGADEGLMEVDGPLVVSTRLEAEMMTLSRGAGEMRSDAAASGGRAALLWTNGSVSGLQSVRGLKRITVRARGDLCNGAPQMLLKVDGVTRMTKTVSNTAWGNHSVELTLNDGTHQIEVVYTNDAVNGCDRNLYVDSISFWKDDAAADAGTTPGNDAGAAPVPADAGTPVTPSPSGNPLAGAKLFVDPSSSARQTANAWKSSRPADAAQLEKIANASQADWYGGWESDIQTAIRNRVDQAVAQGAIPVLVAYNIPQRDCGYYSAGGVGSPEAYRTWIRGFAAGIGNRKAVVILEPDALPFMECLSEADKAIRFSLLKEATQILQASGTVSVYLDAGHSTWHAPDEAARRLNLAGIQIARGFTTNVSNFNTTANEIAYGREISKRVGNKPFIVDTGRNGLGPSSSGNCNPAGRALGNKPTGSTGQTDVDGFLWIKRPGESDGSCNGAPGAGTWMPDYALGLAQRAAY